MMEANPDGPFTVAQMVHQARMAVGRGSKKDTPRHILKHYVAQSELFGVVLAEAERAEVLSEAELQIAREQLEQAQERLQKAELAVELAKAKRARQAS